MRRISWVDLCWWARKRKIKNHRTKIIRKVDGGCLIYHYVPTFNRTFWLSHYIFTGFLFIAFVFHHFTSQKTNICDKIDKLDWQPGQVDESKYSPYYLDRQSCFSSGSHQSNNLLIHYYRQSAKKQPLTSSETWFFQLSEIQAF